MAPGVACSDDDDDSDDDGKSVVRKEGLSGRYKGKSLRLHAGDDVAEGAEAQDDEEGEEEEDQGVQETAAQRQERQRLEQEARIVRQQQQQQDHEKRTEEAAAQYAAAAEAAAAAAARVDAESQQQAEAEAQKKAGGRGAARAREHVRPQWHALLDRLTKAVYRSSYKNRITLACEIVPAQCRLSEQEAKELSPAALLEQLKEMEFAAQALPQIAAFVRRCEADKAQADKEQAANNANISATLAAAVRRRPAVQRDILKVAAIVPNTAQHIQATIFRYLTVKAYHDHTVTMSPQPQLWSTETPPLTRWEFDDAMRLITVEVDKALVVVRPGFIDMSKNHGQAMMWEHVAMLEPLNQLANGRGFVRLRTNARFMRKLRDRTLLRC